MEEINCIKLIKNGNQKIGYNLAGCPKNMLIKEIVDIWEKTNWIFYTGNYKPELIENEK